MCAPKEQVCLTVVGCGPETTGWEWCVWRAGVELGKGGMTWARFHFAGLEIREGLAMARSRILWRKCMLVSKCSVIRSHRLINWIILANLFHFFRTYSGLNQTDGVACAYQLKMRAPLGWPNIVNDVPLCLPVLPTFQDKTETCSLRTK